MEAFKYFKKLDYLKSIQETDMLLKVIESYMAKIWISNEIFCVLKYSLLCEDDDI